MHLAANILGIAVFLAAGWLLSHDRKRIRWQSVGILTALNLLVAWVLTSFPWGRAAVEAAAAGFNEFISVAWQGVSFALGNWVGPEGVDPEPVNFVVSALLPILLIVPVFDILTYIGFLPWLIRWVGRGLSVITRQPRFETFFAIEMMFLGNTEAIAVSKNQLQRMRAERDVVIAMMSMSCVTASILAAYMQMMPAEFVLTAVPVNCLNALIVTSMLYPVEVAPEEDVIMGYTGVQEEAGDGAPASAVPAAASGGGAAGAGSSPQAKAGEAAGDRGRGASGAARSEAGRASEDHGQADRGAGEAGQGVSGADQPSGDAEARRAGWRDRLPALLRRDPAALPRPPREPFFSFLGDSILGGGRLILIITANVIAFVALAALVDRILGLVWAPLSLESILGVLMFVPALLLGLDPGPAWEVAQLMGLKLVTNEFVAMGEATGYVSELSRHHQAVLTVFLTSFANFGTLGQIIGAFKGLVDKERNDLISKNVGRMLLSGVLVSLMSASIVGLFVW